LLDTHIALWLDSGDVRLRRSTRDLIDDCWRNDGTVLISAITAWEVALLVERGQINLDLPAVDWIARFAESPGLMSLR
jgi:PIN domain nuclease of toxin-antitoxin system